MITLLTREALEMINISSSPHNHFKGRNNFTASSTMSGISKKSVKKKWRAFIIDWVNNIYIWHTYISWNNYISTNFLYNIWINDSWGEIEVDTYALWQEPINIRVTVILSSNIGPLIKPIVSMAPEFTMAPAYSLGTS